MNYRLISVTVIVAITLGLIGYDILPFQSPVDHDTLSEVMRDGGGFAAYAWGFLAGHFFVQVRERTWSHANALAAGGWLGLHVGLFSQLVPDGWGPLLSLVLGVVAGASLWPLEKRDA